MSLLPRFTRHIFSEGLQTKTNHLNLIMESIKGKNPVTSRYFKKKKKNKVKKDKERLRNGSRMKGNKEI